MNSYDKWLDKGNPTTEATELSKEKIENIKLELINEIERVIDFYGEDLSEEDIADVIKNFV